LDGIDRLGGLEQVGAGLRRVIRDLTQWTDVVDNPETSPMCRHDKVIAVNLEISHRRRRKVELERLPVGAIVERDECSAFGSCKQHPASRRVFTRPARSVTSIWKRFQPPGAGFRPSGIA
jgi:hypothetical protein